MSEIDYAPGRHIDIRVLKFKIILNLYVPESELNHRDTSTEVLNTQ